MVGWWYSGGGGGIEWWYRGGGGGIGGDIGWLCGGDVEWWWGGRVAVEFQFIIYCIYLYIQIQVQTHPSGAYATLVCVTGQSRIGGYYLLWQLIITIFYNRPFLHFPAGSRSHISVYFN